MKTSVEPVHAYRCDKCGALHYPYHTVCKVCGNRVFDEIPLEGVCTLITWTRVFNLPEGYMKPSLTFGIVEYPNGIRAAGQLDVSEPNNGMSLITTVGVVKEGVGEDYLGLIFVAE